LNPRIFNNKARHKRFSTLEPETPASSARSLCYSRRRSGSGPLAVDQFAAEVLPAGGCAQRIVPGQVRGWPENATCGAQTRLPWNARLASESEDLRSMAPPAVPLPMGGLRQTPVRRCATRASLSRPVHPSRSDFKPSTRRPCRWHGHLSMARFRSQKQTASDDAPFQRVPTPIPAACVAAWIRPYPLLWAHGSSSPQRIAAALLTAACPIRPGSGRSWL
jgi:hypothetical protein